jgi:ribosomal protein S12 methylthiotransferase accessory factor
MGIKITFPGNLKVNAEINGRVIPTDQEARAGGDGTAPAPFEYFLSSLGTCAGIYVLSFCKTRGIPTDGIEINQEIIYDPIKQKIGKVLLDIQLPEDFPEKYKDAVIRAADQCAVKKYLQDPFEVETIATVRELELA